MVVSLKNSDIIASMPRIGNEERRKKAINFHEKTFRLSQRLRRGFDDVKNELEKK